MKKKSDFIMFYILGMVYYVLAIISFTGEQGAGNGAIWMCLGSSMVCIGSSLAAKSAKEKKDEKVAEG